MHDEEAGRCLCFLPKSKNLYSLCSILYYFGYHQLRTASETSSNVAAQSTFRNLRARLKTDFKNHPACCPSRNNTAQTGWGMAPPGSGCHCDDEFIMITYISPFYPSDSSHHQRSPGSKRRNRRLVLDPGRRR